MPSLQKPSESAFPSQWLSRAATADGVRLDTFLSPSPTLRMRRERVDGVAAACGIEVEGLVRPYQRVSDEIDEQIRRWYRLGMSLRHLAEALEHSWISPLSLRTLMTRLHLMAEEMALPWPSQTPPIVQVDAIWVTLIVPTGVPI